MAAPYNAVFPVIKIIWPTPKSRNKTGDDSPTGDDCPHIPQKPDLVSDPHADECRDVRQLLARSLDLSDVGFGLYSKVSF